MKRLLNSVKHYGFAAVLCGAASCFLLMACASIGPRIQTDRLEDQAYNSVNGILTVDCSPNPLPSERRWSVEYDAEDPSTYTWQVFSNGVGTASWNQRLYDYDGDDLIRIRLVSYWKNSTGDTIIAGLHPSQRIDLNLSSNDQDLSLYDQDLSSTNIGKIQIHLTVSGHSKPASDGHLKTSHLDEVVHRVEYLPKGGRFYNGEPDQDGHKYFNHRALQKGLVPTADCA